MNKVLYKKKKTNSNIHKIMMMMQREITLAQTKTHTQFIIYLE